MNELKHLILLTLAFLVAVLSLTANATAATSQQVSQYGITWTFSAPAQVGQFVNGDWWVIGPVTVSSVSPAPANGRHGSVLNPPAGRDVGYDSRFPYNYNAALRASFPLTMNPGDSLVSTISIPNIGDSTPDTVDGQHRIGPIQTAAVLTCVSSAPPADAFRPPYCGSDKTIFRRSQLQLGLLPGLAPPANVPDVGYYERMFQRVWLDHRYGWASRYLHPYENMPDYGREIANCVKTAGLMLLLDNSNGTYDTLLTRYVQLGIDLWGICNSNNYIWSASGGHDMGRIWPIIFAGILLNHNGMKNISNNATFAENQHCYAGTGYRGQTVLWRIDPSLEHEHINPANWTDPPLTSPNDGWKSETYRLLVGPTWPGVYVCAVVMQARSLWNYEPFFEYVERWVDERANGSVDRSTLQPKGYSAWSSTFEQSMWETYSNYQPGETDTTPPYVSNAASQPPEVAVGVDTSITVTAHVSDSGAGTPGVATAEYYINTDPGQGNGTPLSATDGAFDSTEEDVSAVIDVSSWVPENSPYTVYLRARDLAGNWCAPVPLSISVHNGGEYTVFLQDENGLICVEAESYHLNQPRGDHSWVLDQFGDYSGGLAMRSTPNIGANLHTNYAATSPRLDYQVQFVRTGVHYVWVRGVGPTGSDDSLHVGLDGNEIETSKRISLGGSGTVVWRTLTMAGTDAYFTVATTGLHTINVWMSEDGVIVDKVLVTTDPNYTPSGSGPNESVRIPEGDTDTTAPSVTNLACQPAAVVAGQDNTITVTAHVEDTGAGTPSVAQAEYFVGTDPGVGNGTALAASDGAFDSATENITGTIDVSGWQSANSPYTVSVRARDGAGNWSAVSSVQVTVTPGDTEAPQAAIVSPANGAVVTETPLTVQGTASDASTITAVTVNGTAATTSNGYANWSAAVNLSEGANQIVVATQDEYGNSAGQAASITVTLDTTTPAVTVTSPADGAHFTTNQITVEGTASDNTGVAWVKVNGVQAQTSNGYATWSCAINLVEGTNQITVAVQDDQGNTNNQAVVLNVSCDSLAPSAVVTSPGDGDTVTTTEVTVRGTASDASAITYVKVNGVAAQTSDGFANWSATVNLAEGPGQITVSTQDEHGNTNNQAVILNVTVDSLAPTVVVTSPTDGQVKTSDVLIINGTASDASTIVAVKVNGVLTQTSDGFANWNTFVTLQEGDNQIVVSAEDEHGNVNEQAVVLNISLDTKPPAIVVNSPADGAVLNSGAKVTVNGTATDAHAIISLTVNGVSAHSTDGYATWTVDLTNLDDGENQIAVVAKDEYNNESDAVTLTVTIDSTPPTVSVSSPADGAVVTESQLTIQGTASDAGGITYVKVNGVDAQTSDGFAHWSAVVNLAEGANQITVSTADDRGNTDGEAAVLNLTLDSQPPVVAIVAPQQGQTLGSTQVLVSGTATDSSVISWVKVNGVEASTTNGYASWIAQVTLQNGPGQSIVVSAADVNGNENQSAAQLTVTVDITLDSDDDGIPDAWETSYGLNPNDPSDANEDLDGDGFTNLQEYQNGTDPNNIDEEGPSITNNSAVPNSVRAMIDNSVSITATVSDLATGASVVNAAEYFIDNDPGAGNGYPMSPADGSFDSAVEVVTATVDTSSWIRKNSSHTIYIRGRDTRGNWGQAVGIEVEVIDGLPPGKVKHLRVLPGQAANEPYMASVALVSSEVSGTYSAAAAIDGQVSTWWASQGSADPRERQYLIIDLGQDQPVGRIEIKPRGDYTALFPKTFKVKLATQEAYDDAGDKVNDLIWQTLVTESDFATTSSDAVSWNITEQTGRYVMLDVREMNVDPQTGEARAEVAEITVEPTDKSASSLTVVWTAPGNDGDEGGNAFAYDIRISRSPIDPDNFANAEACDGEPPPEAPGTEQTFVIEGLQPGTVYYIAMRTVDEAQNASELAHTAGTTEELSTAGIDILTPDDEDTIRLEEGPPTYRWHSLVYTRFNIHFGSAPNFPRGSLKYRAKGSSSFTPSAQQWKAIRKLAQASGGTLYWRVQGSAGTAKGYSATFHQFDLDAGSITLGGTPDGAVLQPDHPATFTWGNTDNAIVLFQVEISPTLEFQRRGRGRALALPRAPSNIYSLTLTDREWKAVKKLTHQSDGGILYWRAKGFDADKAFVVVSPARSFRFDLGTFSAEAPTGDLSALGRPGFSWTYVGALKHFQVEVGLNADFSGGRRETITVPSRWTADSSHPLSKSELYRYIKLAAQACQGAGPHQLYWRVKARSDDRLLTLTGQTQTINLLTEAINLTAPAAGSALDPDTPPSFSWALQHGGEGLFSLQFCKTSDFTFGVYTVGRFRLTGTGYTLTDKEWAAVKRQAVDENGRGYWRVMGADLSKRYFSLQSEAREFNVPQ